MANFLTGNINQSKAYKGGINKFYVKITLRQWCSVLYYYLCIDMLPMEYLPTQGQDDSSTVGVFQCTVLYHTILYKTIRTITAIPCPVAVLKVI